MFKNMFRKQFPKIQDAWILAHAIVDTVRQPIIVLDQDLRVVAAEADLSTGHSRSMPTRLRANSLV